MLLWGWVNRQVFTWLPACINVDEWVHCPIARPSPPSSIQIGNWVLIECNGDGRRREKKTNNKSKLKHKEGTCWHSMDSTVQQATVSVLDDFGPNIHSSPFVFLLFDSRLFSVLSLLFFAACLRHGFAFQSKLLLLPSVLSVSNSSVSFIYLFFSFTASSSFCRWVNITGGQKAPLQQRVKRRETGTHTIVIYRWMKWLLSISFLLSLPSRISHNICTPTELL